MVSDEQLLDDLKEFADEIGKTPTQSEMQEYGPWGSATYQRHFGCWNKALNKAGIKINNESPVNLSDEQLLEDLKEFADEIGRTPKQKEMREGGPWSVKTYQNHFDTWNNALRKAGIEINKESPANLSDEQLLEDLKEFTDEIGRTPTRYEMREDGPRSPSTYYNHFGSWNNSLKKAGISVNRKNTPEKTSDEQLLEDLKEFADEIGRTPKQKEMREGGPWSAKKYQNHFDTWNNALRKAGLTPNKKHSESDEQLLDDLKDFADEIGRTPSVIDMNENGPWDRETYSRHFGSWNNSLKKAGLKPNVDYDLDVKWDESVTDYYGKSYKQMREKVIKRDDSKCRSCSSEEILHVHHIKPRRLFGNPDDSNTLDNLITLCPSCHKIFENEWTECNPNEFAERAKASLNK